MKLNQIKYILQQYGLSTDTWCVLPTKIESITLLGEVVILNNPLTVNFYFDSNGVIFIRRLNGKPYPTTEDSELANDFVRLEMNNSLYDIKMMPYGITSSNKNIGKYHESIAMSTVVGFVEIGIDYLRPRDNIKKIAIKSLVEKIDIDTTGDTVNIDDRDIFIYPVYSEILNDKDSYKTVLIKGTVNYNHAEDKYLALIKFYSNKAITSKSFVKLDGTYETDYIGNNFLFALVNVADEEQIVEVSFDGNVIYKIKIIADLKNIILKR